MKKRTRLILVALFASSICVASQAADSACAPILAASEAHAKADRTRVRMLTNNRSDEIEAMLVPEGMYIKAGDQGSTSR